MHEFNPQSRKWQLTINNPTRDGYTHEEIKRKLLTLKSLAYFCMSDELASTHHTHVYFLFNSPVRFSTIKNLFPHAHIEKAYGTSAENRDYVFKDGKWVNDKKKETNLIDTHEEYGTIPPERQGARNDCAELYEMITEGMSNYEIINENPDLIKHFERIDKVRQTIQEERYKNTFRELEVSYYYGETGSGKTRTIMEEHGYTNVYRITNYKNPFDQYQGQDVIVFEEFHDSMPIMLMLIYLDGYPLMLPCRYADKVACFTKVYILTNRNLTEQYKDIQLYDPLTWKAFLRRIHTIKVFFNNKITTYTSIEEYLSRSNEFTHTKQNPFDEKQED